MIEIDPLFESNETYTSVTCTHLDELCQDPFLPLLQRVEKVLRDAETDKSSEGGLVINIATEFEIFWMLFILNASVHPRPWYNVSIATFVLRKRLD